MKVLLLPIARIVELDDDDLPLFSKARWSVSKKGQTYYACGRVDGVPTLLHRLITNAPPDFVVDHRDGNGLNNRRENLRLVTQQHNLWNTRRAHGVCRDTSGRWRAVMTIHGERRELGTFSNEADAQRAWDFCVKVFRGEFGTSYGHDVRDFDILRLSPTARRLVLGEAA